MKKYILMSAFLAMCLFATGQTLLVNKHAFTGKFNGTKITVSLWFEETSNGALSGEMVYTSSKKKTPIRVLGYSFTSDDGTTYYSLTEYQPDGNQTGRLLITKDKKGVFGGEWSEVGKLDNIRSYNVSLVKSTFPQGKGGTFTYSSKPVGHFTYNYHHEVKEEQGGSVDILPLKSKANIYKVQISKYDPQLADYEGELSFKNGVMHGSLEDCGYEFTVNVFKDFVFIRTTSKESSYDCFGAHTTLDGFYIRR